MIYKEIILVTGGAGFIGSSLINELIKNESNIIISIDNLTPYYDVNLKYKNLERNKNDRFVNYFVDITDKSEVDKIFDEWNFTQVYHLAAQAGVRYSIDHQEEVIKTNIIGFQNIIENVISHNITKFIYASSSSVYGDMYSKEINDEENPCNEQRSPYAVTKKSNELMATMYSLMHPEIKMSGLRFFTVYGPYMRPDLAIGKFTKNILNNEPIEIYGDGTKERDFTYIDDIVRIMMAIMNSDKEWSHEIFNIGYGNSISVNEMVQTIKDYINPNYDKIIYKGDAEGDVNKTLAVNEKIKEWFGEGPQVEIHDGLKKYIDWYINGI